MSLQCWMGGSFGPFLGKPVALRLKLAQSGAYHAKASDSLHRRSGDRFRLTLNRCIVRSIVVVGPSAGGHSCWSSPFLADERLGYDGCRNLVDALSRDAGPGAAA